MKKLGIKEFFKKIKNPWLEIDKELNESNVLCVKKISDCSSISEEVKEELIYLHLLSSDIELRLRKAENTIQFLDSMLFAIGAECSVLTIIVFFMIGGGFS